MSKDMLRQWKSKWNSFNGAKALVHVPYWKPIIEEDRIPFPLFVSIDPCGVCNLRCHHCNAAEILRNKHTVMDKERIDTIIDMLVYWKTKSACVGGGGEPLMNKNTYYLINELHKNKIQSALVTNGTHLGEDVETLLKLTYAGISVDAATTETWQKVKGTDRYTIENIFDNIRKVTGKGLEITYKYLLLPSNFHEVYEACKIAKDLGCEQFHLRPAAPPWFENERSYNYDAEIRASVNLQLDKARDDFEDDNFKIFGVVQKFSDEWKTQLTFKKCWTCYTTCAISPDGTVTLCCDRRGDATVELGNIKDMKELWGSKEHKMIHRLIDPRRCPRCTFGHVNEIFEQVIQKDCTNYNFF
jgi:MoaA/NifB/PqqE/SkfB family radical SAM enzyme